MRNAQELGPEWLAEKFRKACRRAEERKIGLEVERIGLYADGTSLTYRGDAQHPGAQRLLSELAPGTDWKLVNNSQGEPLGMSGPVGKVSLEPGSQLELSANPDGNLVNLARTIAAFEDRVTEISQSWGLKFITLGVNPIAPVNSIDVIPSTRYHIMTDYLGKRARLGTSMMRLTSSVQINLDYTSEAEAVEMLRVALAATPLSYALFANSPFAEGKETGLLSFRQQIWRETDPDRTGLAPEVFQPGFGFDTYAKLAWNRPLMFAQNPEGKYIPAHGLSVAEIAEGKLPGATVTESNLTNSVQELFFEARLKPGYVEIRSLDGQSKADRYASTAFWTGLLYRPEARRLTLELLGGLTTDARERLFDAAGRVGLEAREGNVQLAEVAKALVAAARETLVQRGRGEEKLLEPLERTLTEGKNPAQRWIAEFRRRGSPSDPKQIAEMAFLE